jgi:hypothetical protein
VKAKNALFGTKKEKIENNMNKDKKKVWNIFSHSIFDYCAHPPTEWIKNG